MQAGTRQFETTVGAALAALLAVGAVVLSRSSGPILWDDEGTYLLTAVEFSRLRRPDLLLFSPTYSSGYSLILAPVVAVLGATRSYYAALAVNTLAVVIVFLMASRLAREFLPDNRVSRLLVPLVAASYPSLLMQATRAWPEALLTALVTAWVFYVVRFATSLKPSDWVAVWAVAGVAFIAHHRLLPLLLASMLLPLVVQGLRTADRVKLGLAGLFASAGAFVLGSLLDGLADTDAYARSGRVSISAGLSNYVGSIGSFGGQVWALLVGTAGFAALVAVLPSPMNRNRGLWIAALGFVGSVGLTALFLTSSVKSDTVLYSRYIDVFGPAILTIGIVSVIKRRDHLAAVVAIPFALCGSLALAAWKLESFASPIIKIRITSILPWDLIAGDRNRPTTPAIEAWQIALIVSVVGIASVLLFRKSTSLGLVGLLAVNLVAAAAGSAWSLGPWLNITETAGLDVLGHLDDHGETELLVLTGNGRISAMETARAVAYQSGYRVSVSDYQSSECPVPLFALGTAEPPPYPAEAIIVTNKFKSTLWIKTC